MYSDKELEKIQNDIIKQMDQEKDEDYQLKEHAKSIAKNLAKSNKCNVEWNNKHLSMIYKLDSQKNLIYLIVANKDLYKIAPEKYKPLVLTYEILNDLSLEENLNTAVEAYFYHVLGKANVNIEDDSTYMIERSKK